MRDGSTLPPALSPLAMSELRKLVADLEAFGGPWFEIDNTVRADGVIEIAPPREAPLVGAARRFLYDHDLVILFDWSSWEAGREFFRLKDADKYRNLSLEWVLKLLTAVVRNDRFSEGAWADLFASGDGQKLLGRLREIEESRQGTGHGK